MQGGIRSLVSDQGDAFAEVRRSARQAEILIETISPLIEAFTSAACPLCTTVCCVNRHSRYDHSDVIFMTATGKDIPAEDPGIADTDACRFLGIRGCVRKRSQRPYRCTWFFCQALMDQIMQQASSAEYRKFITMLQDITTNRVAMIRAFETISSRLFPCRTMP